MGAVEEMMCVVCVSVTEWGIMVMDNNIIIYNICIAPYNTTYNNI